MTSFQRVIVLGDPKLGKEVKDSLTNYGFDPTFVEIDLAEDGSKSLFKPLALKGGLGDFSLLMAGKTGYFEEKAAFVLICLSPVYGRDPQTLEARMSFEEFLDYNLEGIKEIAVLDPSNGKVLPSVWGPVMDKLLSMDLTKTKVSVVASQIKVAGDGLERKYRMLREQGVVFYKPDEASYVYEHGITIRFRDHILGKDIELKPELLVTLDQPIIPQHYKSLFEILRIEIDGHSYPQDDNVLRFPYYTNRKGVFVVSPLPEFLSKESIGQLISGICLEFKRLFHEMKNCSSKTTIEYNQSQCAYCLTCFRVCPHGAILFDSKPNFLPLACEECGICVANCPGEALKLVQLKYDELLYNIKESIQRGFTTAILACKRNYGAIAELIGNSFDPSRKRPYVFEIPCAGYVNENLLLRMAAMGGLEKITIVGCKEGNCRTSKGTLRGEMACGAVERLLNSLRIESPILAFFKLSSQDHIGLRELMGQV